MDSITGLAETIHLLQNNCTFINAFLNKNETIKKQFEQIASGIDYELPSDFCAITTFTPVTITFAMRFIEFVGYTGEISFNYNSITRKSKN